MMKNHYLLSKVETRQGKEYAEDMGAIFVETSALTAENVYEVFSQICKYLQSFDACGKTSMKCLLAS